MYLRKVQSKRTSKIFIWKYFSGPKDDGGVGGWGLGGGGELEAPGETPECKL